MSGKMTLRGSRELRVVLTDSHRLVKNAGRRELRAIGQAILEGSVARAPKDTGDLEKSHKLVIEPGGRTKDKVAVTAGPVWSKGDKNGEGSIDYSLEMHEGINGTPYNLGPKSETKNANLTPHYGWGVGWKFLERSFRHVERKAMRLLADGISLTLRNLRPGGGRR